MLGIGGKSKGGVGPQNLEEMKESADLAGILQEFRTRSPENDLDASPNAKPSPQNPLIF